RLAHAHCGNAGGIGHGLRLPPTAVESRVGRNTVFNLVGQAVPAAFALVAIPYTLHGLGVARFGILSLTWALIAYLAILDLGLGRATVRFVSDAVGRDEGAEIPAIVWTSIAVQVALGLAGAGFVGLATPWLVGSLIKV